MRIASSFERLSLFAASHRLGPDKSSSRKMIGKLFYGIRLMYRFMKLVGNISEQAASGCQNAINHICCELPMRF